MNTKFEKDVKRVCLLYYFQIFEQNLKTKITLFNKLWHIAFFINITQP